MEVHVSVKPVAYRVFAGLVYRLMLMISQSTFDPDKSLSYSKHDSEASSKEDIKHVLYICSNSELYYQHLIQLKYKRAVSFCKTHI